MQTGEEQGGSVRSPACILHCQYHGTFNEEWLSGSPRSLSQHLSVWWGVGPAGQSLSGLEKQSPKII